MAEFAFLFRGANDMSQDSPERAQQLMERWRAWMKDLTTKGFFKGGQPLERGGKVVDRNKSVTDGPYAEAKDLVGGFIVVECKDLLEAAELSKGCPIFTNNGFVEVRPVMKMDM